MNKYFIAIKYIIALAVTALVIWLLYFGIYSPFMKAQLYVDVSRDSQNIHTLGDLTDTFKPAMEFPSPVGQDEVVSSYTGVLYSIVSHQTQEAVIRAIISEAEKWAIPFLDKGKGFNYNQTLFNIGSIYEYGAIKLKDQGYFMKSLEYFKLGSMLSPGRQAFVYGLINLYQIEGDVTNLKKEVDYALTLWPSDQNLQTIANGIK